MRSKVAEWQLSLSLVAFYSVFPFFSSSFPFLFFLLSFILPLPFFFPITSDIGPHRHCLIQPVMQKVLNLTCPEWVNLNSIDNLMGGSENASLMTKKHILPRAAYSLGKAILSKEGCWGLLFKKKKIVICLQGGKTAYTKSADEVTEWLHLWNELHFLVFW